MDDHGTLRDVDGNPRAYRVLRPTLRNVPLMESQVWPADMSDWQAERYAQDVEDLANRSLGFVACAGDHATLPCATCRAAI